MRTKILFEDADLLVCHKPAGMAVETKDLRQKDMVSELKNYLAQAAKTNGREENSGKGVNTTVQGPYLAVIHRLDQPVEGVIVFGKSKKAAAELSRQMKENEMGKYYLAAVYGRVEKDQKLTDLLYKDVQSNTSRVVSETEAEELGRENVKKAQLSYQVLSVRKEGGQDISILKVKLDTGRHHQIRVQLSHAGFPLLGDLKYGTKESINLSEEMFLDTVQLVSYELHFLHPVTRKEMKYVLPKVNRVFQLT